ncbi:MAG TPA: S-adenosylmethionine:tRNA ribosyltransferase-isomerase [Thermoanaerobaculia bacterium]|nr:S-adenosylmethionine:tRNA ribosyltransferase-isomerase [Thermoanaerobaculia bacterium]
MSALEFSLPPQLEAHEPAELRGTGRDDVRMIVSDRATGEVFDTHFRELPNFLHPGDLLVLNTSGTLPAALTALRENGEEIAMHWSTSLPGGLSVVEPRKVEGRGGEVLTLPGGAKGTLLAPYRNSRRLWIAQLDIGVPIIDYLRRWGRPIRYPYIAKRFPLSAYQTVYAQLDGSAEMPSAGRAFTKTMLACLRARGVGIARLVLHTGVASLESHEAPYEEWYEVPLRTAERVREAKTRGGRVIAVGTTVVRALESSVDANGELVGSRGWTDLVITPDRGVRIVDGLLTGLHEPRATHLAMLEAIAGKETIEKAYAAALEHEYLWHEFGDLHLIV